MKNAFKYIVIVAAFLLSTGAAGPARSWVWNSSDAGFSTLKDEFDGEVAAYRQRVGNGMTLRERILTLDRLIGNYKPLGVNVADLELEQSRLALQEKQEQLRAAQAQSEATLLYEKGVSEYRDGQFQMSLNTMRETERLIPNDDAIKELRRKLEGITPVLESETGTTMDGQLLRLAVIRYLENDPKRSMNALVYASEKNIDRPEILRLQRVIESNHPDLEAPRQGNGVSFVEYKLQQTLEAIYEGRYITAINECNDVLDLEPRNVMAMTRLGSAYFAMNDRDKAKQVWTKALQLDPNNAELKKFLYGQKANAKGGR